MRVILLTFMAILSLSCEKQEIKPMFAKKSMAELHGDGQTMNFTIKVPLTQDTLSFYDASSVLEDSSLDEEDPGFIKDVYNSLKYSIFNMGLNLGLYNKLKLSFAAELPKLDSKYLKSLKVKKIFFAIENCEAGDLGCKAFKKSRPANLKLLDKFFVNVQAMQDMSEFTSFAEQEPMLEEEEFEQEEKKAFSDENQKALSIEEGTSLNIARFNGDTKYRKKQRLDTDVHKTGILRLERELSKAQKLELVRELREDAYKDVLKSFSTVGNNIYIEMKTSGSFNRFDELIEQRHGQISNLGVRKFERCSVNLCANLETTNSNLVPLLEKSNQLRFDTFFSIKKLEMNDFKYNGFIELEFKLNLGV